MSVLSVICLASLRKAEREGQKGYDTEEEKWICAESGSEKTDNGRSISCQS